MIQRENPVTQGLYKSYIDNLKDILFKGFVVSPRGKEIRELLSSRLSGKADEENLITINGVRDVSDPSRVEGRYLITELFWYFSGSNRAEFISNYGSLWGRITNDDGTLNSNYGRSVFYDHVPGQTKTKFNWARDILCKDPDTRQAIIPYTSDVIFTDRCAGDFTCTQLQHFFIRENKLHSIVYIRSSDSVFGLNFDIPFWSIAQQIMLMMLKEWETEKFKDLETGNIEILIGSSHIYSTHYELCHNMLRYANDHYSKCCKSLRVDPSAIEGFDSDHPIFKVIEDLIEDTQSEFRLDYGVGELVEIAQWLKHEDDMEVDYGTLKNVLCFSAKTMMKIYRYAYYSNGGKMPGTKDYWFNWVKKWFDTFFRIV